MLRAILSYINSCKTNTRYYATIKQNDPPSSNNEFETVFSFPFIKYVSVVNRLKVYQIVGTSIAVPGCGILEMLNAVPSDAFLSSCYIGFTAAAVMSLATLPFRNIIGFIYISKDNEKVKISYLDYWGRRRDKIVPVEEWKPLLDLNPKLMDPIYVTPELTDGSKYKLFIKFGKVLNSKKIGQVLE